MRVEDTETKTPGMAASPAGAVVLSVIIVSWNTRALVLQCIRHIRERQGALPVEIILADNGSVDGTVAAVRESYPDVVVIANGENLGFPRPNNQGLRVARGKYVLFLNSDTIVGPGTLEACVAELDRHPTVAMVTCRLVYPDGRVQYEAGRRRYMLRHLLWEAFYLHVLFPHSRVFAHQVMGDWDHLDTRDVDAISGAFMMVRRHVAEQVGGLPEDLFMYHEDLSFCLRVRKLGLRIRYLGSVETLHLAGGTSTKYRERWYLLEGEVRTRLVRESQGAVAAGVARLLFGVREAVRLTVALLGRAVPGLGPVRARHRRVFDIEQHALQLAWCISPRLVRGLIPAPGRIRPPAAVDAAC